MILLVTFRARWMTFPTGSRDTFEMKESRREARIPLDFQALSSKAVGTK